MIGEARKLLSDSNLANDMAAMAAKLLEKNRVVKQQVSQSPDVREPSILSQTTYPFKTESFIAEVKRFEKEALENFKNPHNKRKKSISPPSFSLHLSQSQTPSNAGDVSLDLDLNIGTSVTNVAEIAAQVLTENEIAAPDEQTETEIAAKDVVQTETKTAAKDVVQTEKPLEKVATTATPERAKSHEKVDISSLMETPVLESIHQIFPGSNEEKDCGKGKGKEIIRGERRAKRLVLKLPASYRSPILAKNSDTFKSIPHKRKMVVDYAFFNELPMEKEIYKDYKTTITRKEMLTMSGDTHIVSNIIDAWSYIMNFENLSRKDTAPGRFFFSTYPFVILFGNAYTEKQKEIDAFLDRLQNELIDQSNTDDTDLLCKIKKLSMVFFPVVRGDHYYLLCIDMQKSAFELLDNRILEEGISFKNKYDNHRKQLLRMFTKFLRNIGYDQAKADNLEKKSTKTLNMKWRSNKNYDDCGIFLMKHMETYNGEKDTEWDCGLQTKYEVQLKQLKKLRVKYCAKILLHKENTLHNQVLKYARVHSKEKVEEKR
ncbi:uncharacterized protein LOC110688857 [Chenopodium quinoa]|uniref:uncharacterized protein LOC110688857 n=1 Tax=Chenopodium quinoa TaxID=63459 RepID=UPI000B780282|nr:uncharacterized protein LOC110688857 [Chenopodium quinoa]XP_021721308.1 uncharacterized protein LOC110688857 [Chenopodium quinoa]XP_021721309.1 uncharacterized protein LOC110688857 [Chenopodium quinoa]